jgi:hypothetical protein
MSIQFTDSVAGNFELAKELIQGMPGGAQVRCRNSGNDITNYWYARMKATKDPAEAMGMVFALFYIAEKVINNEGGNDGMAPGDKLILTL